MKTIPAKTKKSALVKSGKRRKNPLVGATQPELDSQDKLMESVLSRIAVSNPKPEVKSKSRFWFTVTDAADYVAASKKALKRPELEHVDKDIEDRLKTYKDELPPVLSGNITTVREFFLKEIAPLTMASGAGTLQSREVAARLLSTDIDSAIFGRFENMVNRAAVIKMGLFVLDYFKLPPEHYHSLIGSNGPTPTPLENEIKKIMEQLQNVPSRKDLNSLSSAVNHLTKQVSSNGNNRS